MTCMRRILWERSRYWMHYQAQRTAPSGELADIRREARRPWPFTVRRTEDAQMFQVGETALTAGAEGNALSSTGAGQHALTARAVSPARAN